MNKSKYNWMAIMIILGLMISGCQLEKKPTKIGEVAANIQAEDGSNPQVTRETIYEVGDIIRIDQTVLVVLGWDQPPGTKI